MLNLRRIEYVTSHYQEIQGLRIVPFGLWLISIATLGMGGYLPARSPQAGAAVLLACLLGGLVALIAYRAIGQRYERDYGVVRPLREPRPRALSGCLSGAGYLFVLYIGVMAGTRQVAAELSLVLAALLLILGQLQHAVAEQVVPAGRAALVQAVSGLDLSSVVLMKHGGVLLVALRTPTDSNGECCAFQMLFLAAGAEATPALRADPPPPGKCARCRTPPSGSGARDSRCTRAAPPSPRAVP